MEDSNGLHLFRGNFVAGKANLYVNGNEELLSNHDLIASTSQLIDDYVGLGHGLPSPNFRHRSS